MTDRSENRSDPGKNYLLERHEVQFAIHASYLCDTCKGTGATRSEEVCPFCKGAGRVRHQVPLWVMLDWMAQKLKTETHEPDEL